MPSTPTRPFLELADGHPALSTAIAAGRSFLRNDRTARSVVVTGIDLQGRVVEATLRSADGPARRRVVA